MRRTARLLLFYQPRSAGVFTRQQQTHFSFADAAQGITLLEHMKTADHDHSQTSSRRRLARQACVSTALLAVCALGCILASQRAQAQAASSTGQLRIYSVDVEGGQSTLLVAPSGESMLVDTGWPGNNGRDAERICAEFRHGLCDL